MRPVANEDLYQRCDFAFLESIATSVKACIARSALTSNEQRQSLLEEVIFAIAAHLSGSSHGGDVDGEEIYLKIIYLLGDNGSEYLVGSSAMHEQASRATRRLTF